MLPLPAALSNYSQAGPIGLCRLDSMTTSGSPAPSVWQKLTVACLAVTAGVMLHIFCFHLHDILVPFFLSGFIVFALQPAVEYIYCLFAGLVPPYRWCIICTRRRTKASDRAEALRKKARDGPDDAAYGCCWGGDAARQVKQEEQEILETEPLLETVPTMATMFLDAIIRLFAVLCVLACLLSVVLFFFYLLGHGAMQLKDNWAAYRNGLRRLQQMEHDLVDQLSKEFHMEDSVDLRLKDAYDKLLERTSDILWEVVNEVVRNVTEGLGSLLIMLLYVLFWLIQPLPTGGRISGMVRSYLWKKALVSFLYGIHVALLFYCLRIDLYVFFGVISFFLNFVPEVGAFISMTIPIPVILLDGRIDHPVWVLGASLLGQVILKFIFSNVMEVKLIERDTEMNIHPVWVIAGLSYFGYIWGPMGALLSVPLMAIIKMAALSYTEGHSESNRDEVFTTLAQIFVACCEGRPKEKERGDGNESPREERRPPSRHSNPLIPALMSRRQSTASASGPLGLYPGPISPPATSVSGSPMDAVNRMADAGLPQKRESVDSFCSSSDLP
mmetsp:Transcript_4132/g.11221  ORF Transcript_4132/g.11221 Transcript_4132/m.11221 type:complete len:556 (-) Transcript_4132:119-1786(-)